jgi:hypothetical protein
MQIRYTARIFILDLLGSVEDNLRQIWESKRFNVPVS